MKLLVQMPMSQKPESEGPYVIASENLISGVEYFQSYYSEKDGWSLPGIQSWFKEIDMPDREDQSEHESHKWSATAYLNSHNLERGKSFNFWKVIVRGAFKLGFRAGANFILNKLK